MEVSNSSMMSSLSSLETFANIVGSVPYVGFRINVYKVKSNVPNSEDPPRYVYMPALLLDHCHPKSRRNQVSGRAELLFTVQMWDEELEAKVFEYVTKRDATAQPHQIQVIPFKSVIVTSIAPSMRSSGWIPYQGIEKELKVTMVCSSMEEAKRLANEMKTDPSQFLPILKVKFSLETPTVRRKETYISSEHVRDGELFGQLLQRYPEAETILLTADGVERLISESLTKVIVDSFDDNEVVTKDSVLYSKLRDLIVDSQVTINEQCKGMWDSVFWDKDNYRPDRAAKIITDAYNHSDDQSRSKLRNIFSSTSSNSVDVDQMLKDVVVCRRSESCEHQNNGSAKKRATFSADENRSEDMEDQEQNSNEKTSEVALLHEAEHGHAYGLFSVERNCNFTGGNSFPSKTASADVQDRDSTSAQSSRISDSKTIAGSRSSNNEQNNEIAEATNLSKAQDESKTERKGTKRAANQESFYDDQQKEELVKVLKNSKNYVEWTGEKFQPKPMSLTRVHLAKFTNRQTFQDTRVTVSYSLATLMTDLHLYPEGSCLRSSSQTRRLDSIELTLRQQREEFNDKVAKQNEQNDSLKSSIQKQDAEIRRNRESQAKLIASTSWGTTDGFLWRVDNVAARMAKAVILESDAFYSWQYGYKLKARVYFNGIGDAKGTHLSVFFKLIPGEYDGLLKWPFSHSVTFSLYDQASDPDKDCNVTKKLDDMPLELRLPTSESYWGLPKFVSHEMLKQRHIKDDVMFLKIGIESTPQKQNDEFKDMLTKLKEQIKRLERKRASQAKLLSSMRWGTTDGFLWRIDNVAARMAKAEDLYSDEFYSWQYGYKLQALVDFNGEGDGEGTHLSVYFKLVPGDYDGILEWPFPHSVTFTLYDQATDSVKASNVAKKLDDMLPEQRLPTSKEYWGLPKFVSLELLKNRQFIKDDVMFLKFSFDRH